MTTTYVSVLEITAGNFVQIEDRVLKILTATHDTSSKHSKLWYSHLEMKDVINDAERTKVMHSKTEFIDRVNIVSRLYRITTYYPIGKGTEYCLHMCNKNDETSFLEIVINNKSKKYDVLLRGLKDRIAVDVEVLYLNGSDQIISWTLVESLKYGRGRHC